MPTPEIMSMSPFSGILSSISLGIGGIAGGILYMRRKMSNDEVVIKNDRAEVGMLSVLQKENEELHKKLEAVTNERNQLWKELAEVSGNVKFLIKEQEYLKDRIKELTAEVSGLRASMKGNHLESDNG